MGVVRSGRAKARIGKTAGSKRGSKVQVGFAAKRFNIVGRTPFLGKATNIAVNQDASKGAVEDRRHILHYDEVLKPAIERVVSALYAEENQSEARVADVVRAALQQRGISRLPPEPDKVLQRLVAEMNSVPENLIPDRADTNKAIEVVRGYLRAYIAALSTDAFAQACVDNSTAMMASYRKLADDTFVLDASGGDIVGERNRIHREILGLIRGCDSPSRLWVLLHDLVHSVTFDFSPNITRDATTRAIAWQKAMASCEDAPARRQLDVLLSLIK